MSRIYIGNVKGPQGNTGATGETGAPGAAATVDVGSVSTTAYGNPAQVINSGTPSAAVFDFVIPQGQPGEEVTDMSGLTLGTMTTQTAQFPTPQIGDNGATLFGKIVKYFSDLRTLIGTKLNTSNVVNNFTTTESGYALDARAGKTLNDSLTNKLGGVTMLAHTIPTTNPTATFTAASNARFLLVCIGYFQTNRTVHLCINDGGTVYFTPVLDNTGITLTALGSGRFSIKNNNQYTLKCIFIGTDGLVTAD